jgi:hypothetical protein
LIDGLQIDDQPLWIIELPGNSLFDLLEIIWSPEIIKKPPKHNPERHRDCVFVAGISCKSFNEKPKVLLYKSSVKVAVYKKTARRSPPGCSVDIWEKSVVIVKFDVDFFLLICL